MSLIATVILASTVLLLRSEKALSQTAGSQNNFFAAITVDNIYDDNANRVSDDGNASPIEERQYAYSLLLGADYRRSLLFATASYSFIEQGFTRGSQEDQSFVIGNSSLSVGNDTSWFGLVASQNQRRSLIANDQELILANTQEQSLLSVSPEIKSKPTGFLQLRVRGEYTLAENELTSDSESTALELSALRPLSESRNIGVGFERREVDIEEDQSLNYSYYRASLSYSSNTRLSEVSISLGRDEISPDVGDNINSDFYSVEFQASLNYFNVNLSAISELTDTSNLNVILVSGDSTVGTAAQGIDQVKSETGQLSFSSNSLCRNCAISISAQYQKLENNNNVLDSNESLIYSASFTYDISTNSNYQLTYSDRSAEFINDPARGLNEKRLRVVYQRELTKTLTSSIYIEGSEQRGNTNEFDRNFFGVQLSLRLE